MPKPKSNETYLIPAAGATKTFNVSSPIDEYNLIATGGTIVLLGDVVISPTGTPKEGMTFIFNYFGNIDLNGHSMTIFGFNMYPRHALAKYIIKSVYTDGDWDTNLIFTEDGIGYPTIDGAYIQPKTIDANAVLADGSVSNTNLEIASARGKLFRSGTGGVWEHVNAVTSGNLVMGNGTDVVSNAVTGDITINGSGVTAIGAGKVTTTMLAYTPMEYLQVNRTFSSVEVLTLYSSNTNTGIELLAAPGVGKYIELISVSAYNNYNTATYAAGTNLLNINVNGIALWTFPNAFIEATTDTASQGTKVGDAIIALNTGIKVQIATADPTVGDGTITISAIYRIKTV